MQTVKVVEAIGACTFDIENKSDCVMQRSLMSVESVYLMALCLLVTCVPGVAAFDTGDTLMLILGLLLGFICICAGLGWWSRR